MEYEKELEVAKEAAIFAGSYLTSNQNKTTSKKIKGKIHNYATDQDIAAENIIISHILKSFPRDSIISEESDPQVNGLRLWIIDPLDGTRNYANGLPYFSVSIALWDNDTKIGVVYAPSLKNMFYAVKGGGLYLNGEKIELINSNQRLESAIVATGFAYYKGKDLDRPIEIYKRVLNGCTDVVRYGSAALDLCNVSVGGLGGYYEAGLKIWDVAAGILFVEEQGGKVTDFIGRRLDIIKNKSNIQILAAKNGKMHSELLKILKD